MENDIKLCIESKLSGLEFKVSEKEEKYFKRVSAGSLNKALKNSLKTIVNMKFEVECKEGVLYDSLKLEGSTLLYLIVNTI
ncbi:hypothetical protein AAHB94_16225 [Bacillus toyonensis]